MNILEYIENGGTVKTSSGHFVDCYLSDDEVYPIHGNVKDFGSFGFKYFCRWTADGIPENLPTTHGLDLNPTLERIVYDIFSRKELSKYESIFELKEQLKS